MNRLTSPFCWKQLELQLEVFSISTAGWESQHDFEIVRKSNAALLNEINFLKEKNSGPQTFER